MDGILIIHIFSYPFDSVHKYKVRLSKYKKYFYFKISLSFSVDMLRYVLECVNFTFCDTGLVITYSLLCLL